jgi:hypothetical protein
VQLSGARATEGSKNYYTYSKLHKPNNPKFNFEIYKSIEIGSILSNVNKRFYSTHNINLKYGSEKELKDRFNNYVLFKEVKNIMNNNPLNNDTQLKIEKLLIDSSVSKYKNDIIELFEILGSVNKNLKEELFNINDELTNLINNFKKRKLFEVLEEKKLNQKELSIFYLSNILNVVDVDFVVGILIGKSLVIMNNSSEEKTSSTKI